MILAEKIVRLRKQVGWSQEELAEKMNVSRQSVSKWESTNSIPDLNRIIMLAELFDVSTDFLLRDENEAF
ncbi:helix-turn-helix transcriptional regulator [Pseudoalteromonas sp. B28]